MTPDANALDVALAEIEKNNGMIRDEGRWFHDAAYPRLLRVIAKLRAQRNGAHEKDLCKPRCCAMWDAELLSILKGEA